MDAGGPFEITWSSSGELLFRENVHGQSFDAALVGAWLDLPRIAKMTGGDADTIELHDTATGQTIIEDVPQAGPTAPLAAAMPLALTTLALTVGATWLAFRGGPDAGGNLGMTLVETLAGAIMATISVYAGARQSEKRAQKRWPDATRITNTQSRRTPGRPHLHRAVVARLSIWRNLLWLTPVTAAGLALFWYAITGRLERGGFLIHEVIWLVLGALMLVVSLHRLSLLLFHRAAAIWIEGGEVVYLSRRVKRAPIWDIGQVAIGPHREDRNLPAKCIILAGEDGRIGIPISGLDEPAEAVRRLKTLLRLPLLRHEETAPWFMP